MGLVSSIFGLPLMPVRSVMSLAELIKQRLDEELTDPASVRRELEAAEQARAAGEIAAEEEAARQQEGLNRLGSGPAPGGEPNEKER